MATQNLRHDPSLLIDIKDFMPVVVPSTDKNNILVQSSFSLANQEWDAGERLRALVDFIQAAQMADADHFIRQLPHGYQTQLSERASNLSQGQRQLLSIARAILAAPSILILDEATSSVDTRTEARIQKSLLRLMEGRTSFVIAHRLSTIRDADQVVVIDHGEIVERGSHQELLDRRGFYHHLYVSQFKGEAICSYPPEDIVIEDYGRTIKKKAKSILSEERSRTEPFSTSLLDGVDLRLWPKKELQRHIGLVMQDVFIFSGSLADNILLGQEQAEPDTLERAITQANARSFIQKLPKGMEQDIGEEGSNLSAGERQLLSFARALAHDPKVLILDEATSSVGPETERLIQEAILTMTRKRTTLVIAHRLSTIRRADRILVMHDGKIRIELAEKEITKENLISASLGASQEGAS